MFSKQYFQNVCHSKSTFLVYFYQNTTKTKHFTSDRFQNATFSHQIDGDSFQFATDSFQFATDSY